MVAVVCAAAVATLAWIVWVVPEGYGLFSNGVDAKVYRSAVRALVEGRAVYDDPVYRGRWYFTYPPFAVLVLAPLGLVSQFQGARLMSAVNIVLLFVLVCLTLRALGFRSDRRFWLTATAATVAFLGIEPARTTIGNGQVNLVLAVLIVGCLTLPTGRWRGVGIGLAAGIKLTPVFFIAYLIVTGQWRAARTAVAVFLATVAVGLLVLRRQAVEYWVHFADDQERIGPAAAPQNQSVAGLLARLDAVGLWRAPSWLWLVVAAAVAVVALYTVRRAHRAGATMLSITIAGMASCAVSPFSWGHHWVWFVPLILIALVHAARSADRERPVTWLWWIAPAALVTATWAWQVQETYGGRLVWRFGSYRLFWHSDRPWVALLGTAVNLTIFAVSVVATLRWASMRDRILRAGGLVETKP
ncbi:putative glycosyltransferase [Gordonia araii NBRC 100433]|uniref:Putative glycosyltransferase n=1 Tax=Gordonia araii NBRC 100433 TaxID=1073574 RepID=G7H1G3_9ACTN|nr:putative glycosyltransferase [Gordonia araii NBRC 100433]